MAKDEGENFEFDEPESDDLSFPSEDDFPGGDGLPDLPGDEEMGPLEGLDDELGPGEPAGDESLGGEDLLPADEIMPADEEAALGEEGPLAEEGEEGALPDFGGPLSPEVEVEPEEEAEEGPKKDYSGKIMLGILAGLLVGLAVAFVGGPVGMPMAYMIGGILVGVCLLALFGYANFLMITREMGNPYVVMLELSLLAILLAIAVFWWELSQYNYDFKANEAKQRLTRAPAVQLVGPSTITAA